MYADQISLPVGTVHWVANHAHTWGYNGLRALILSPSKIGNITDIINTINASKEENKKVWSGKIKAIHGY